MVTKADFADGFFALLGGNFGISNETVVVFAREKASSK